MNLQDWLNYHKNCPLCGAPLVTFLHSAKRQAVKWEEGRMVIVFPMYSTSMKKSSDYKVGYSFDVTSNHFCIEFYTKDGLRIEKEIPFHLRDKFKSYNKNLRSFRFYRRCDSCKRHNYSSTLFKLNFENSSLNCEGEFAVHSEYFGLIQAMEQGSKTPFRIYRLRNIYSKEEGGSHLTWWGDTNPDGTYADRTEPNSANHLTLPLIPFVSPEDTLERIKKLLVFS